MTIVRDLNSSIIDPYLHSCNFLWFRRAFEQIYYFSFYESMIAHFCMSLYKVIARTEIKRISNTPPPLI